jgi:hypothetical protein
VPFEGVLDEGGAEEVPFEGVLDEDGAGAAARLPSTNQIGERYPGALGVTWKAPEHA